MGGLDRTVTLPLLWQVIVVAATLAFAGMAGWSQMQAQIGRVAEHTDTLDQTFRDRIAFADNARAAVDARLRALEIQYAGVGADVRNMVGTMADIKTAVQQMSQQLAKAPVQP